MTIRKKLTLLYSGLLAGFIMLFGVVIFGVIRSAWIETVDATLWETTDQVINNSRAFPIREFGSPIRIGIALPQLDIFRASEVLVQVWTVMEGRSPEMIEASDNLGGFRTPLDESSLGAFTPLYSNVFINDIEVRVLTRNVTVSGQDRPSLNVQAAASLQTINDATEKLSLLMLISGALAVAVSFGMGMWLSNQTLKPIERIIRAADSISTEKDLGTRLHWDGPMDELGRLSSVFNRMMDRLEALFKVQQRFVADVSHELRTPLTTICGNVELAKRYGMDANSLDAIQSETERMSRMVNDLLLLARADYGGLTLDLAEIDLDTILTDVYRQASVLAKDRDLTIRLAHIEPVRVMGNSDRMKQLLLNLVSNAIQFTPDGGRIMLRLERAGETAVLQVADTGIGIAPEHLDHIFERFYQVDSSRHRASDSAGGTGLGLAIARWIAEAHNGSISVQSEVNRGTTFTVRLPALAAFLPDDDDMAGDKKNGGHSSGHNGDNGHSGGLPRLNIPRLRRPVAEAEPEH